MTQELLGNPDVLRGRVHLGGEVVPELVRGGVDAAVLA